MALKLKTDFQYTSVVIICRFGMLCYVEKKCQSSTLVISPDRRTANR